MVHQQRISRALPLLAGLTHATVKHAIYPSAGVARRDFPTLCAWVPLPLPGTPVRSAVQSDPSYRALPRLRERDIPIGYKYVLIFEGRSRYACKVWTHALDLVTPSSRRAREGTLRSRLAWAP